MSPEVGAKLAGRIVYRQLSEREDAVLRLMVQGMSNRVITALKCGLASFQ